MTFRHLCRLAGLAGVLLLTPGCELLQDVLLALCDPENNPECEDPDRGQITGTIAVTGAQSAAAASFLFRDQPPEHVANARAVLAAHLEARGAPPLVRPVPAKRFPAPQVGAASAQAKPGLEERWREGQVIVRAREAVRGSKDELARKLEQHLGDGTQVRVGLCNTETLCRAWLSDEDGRLLDELATAVVATRLRRADELLRYAEVNRVLHALRTPNDDLYSLQWHYGAMRLPSAWDLTTGDDSVVGAVIDTGILTDHPDLDTKVIGGADLISDADVARDGDGRDDDGYDEGDNACGAGCHSHHGSHVAGTMSAETDNAQMVAGVSWQGSLLAVRVLGAGGGDVFDIVGGIYWSIGEDVEGVSRNPNPADVLNMSLGGPGESEAMNEAVADAVATGAIVVVAAGNDDTDASEFTPASAPGALTVAALTNTGNGRDRPEKASYSNFGDVVDIAAPGGEQAEDIDGDGHPDGVLSTVGDDVVFYQGTSMAAPHIAGLAMLMKATDPDVDQQSARALMRDAADDDIDCSQGCGAGLVSAVRVLRTMRGESGAPLVVSDPAVTRIGRGDLDAQVEFENVGDVASAVTITVGGPDRDRVTLSADSVTLDPDESVLIDIALDRTGDDTGEATVTATFDGGGTAESQLLWTDDIVNVATSVEVGALLVDDAGGFTVERIVTTSQVDDYNYKLFNLTPGDYLVIGLTDDDADGAFEENEGVGVYPLRHEPELQVVRASDTIAGIDFVVAPGFEYVEDTSPGTGTVGDDCEGSADCAGGLYCESVLPGGYCTKDCSGGAGCPAGSACFCLGDDGTGMCAYRICLESCVSDDECRTGEGYACDADSTCYP